MMIEMSHFEDNHFYAGDQRDLRECASDEVQTKAGNAINFTIYIDTNFVLTASLVINVTFCENK